MNLDPIDFFPAYDVCRCVTRQRNNRQDYFSGIWTSLLAICVSLVVCMSGIYYYEVFGKNIIQSWSKSNFEHPGNIREKTESVEEMRQEIKLLKAKVDQTDIWRKHLEDLYTKIYHKQDSILEDKLEKALDLYDSDKIGLYDYAAAYSGSSIHSTPFTTPYPINRTLSFFNLVHINVFSNPENLLQPVNLPGSCFAFTGSKGRIRIKLGAKIVVRAVTLDHIRLHEDRGSAPKDFEIYGLSKPNDFEDLGTLLGSFTYDINGKVFQTFQINKNSSFEYIELRILSNYGKKAFTCLYRFRVHNFYVKRNQ